MYKYEKLKYTILTELQKTENKLSGAIMGGTEAIMPNYLYNQLQGKLDLLKELSTLISRLDSDAVEVVIDEINNHKCIAKDLVRLEAIYLAK